MDCGTTDIGNGKKRVYTKYHCPHGKKKPFCIPCGRNGICEHKINKYTCAKCNKGKVKKDNATYHCPHGKKKYECSEGCGGGRYCKHGKQKKGLQRLWW